MLAVSIGVLGLVAAVIAGVVELCILEPGWTPYAVVLASVILFTTAGKYRTATGLMLDAVGAERSRSDDEPALHTMIERLSALADLPAPRLAIVDSPVANAFTSGVRRRTRQS